ncbi:hypothetical protein [Roseivivax sp. CAU 1761]
MQPNVIALSTAAVFSLAVILALQKGAMGAIGVSFISFATGVSAGVFLGFLFSVPRILSSPEVASENAAHAIRSTGKDVGANLLQTNSNLEKISDWLTTMIVGVALINASEIFGFFAKYSAYLQMFSGHAGGGASFLPVVGTLLLVVGFTAGFLAMYLITRLKLASVMADEERKLRNGLPQDTENRVLNIAKDLGDQVPEAKTITTTGRIYSAEAVALMNRLLYKEDGYKRAIEISDSLLGTLATEDPNFWFLRAAAFGQKVSELKRNGDTKEKDQARQEALQAARRAVMLNARFKSELKRISNPRGPDDDLADLAHDDEFIEIVS